MYENKTQGLRTTVPTFILKCEENNNNINDNNNNCESNLEKRQIKHFQACQKRENTLRKKYSLKILTILNKDQLDSSEQDEMTQDKRKAD